ncbi:2-dehydropantoate 2-reductase [Peribacillus sp. B-H-3]|jgi:2-dehydropantoate 2-reductase|uniref:2-dehydropantoate 2-reductase n=1 Tax=Peribacillus sp. B-H-3 TaxID=3400420 RepID=UPI003B024C7D
MKIGIIGGGAVGLLFAAYLNDDHEITIYTRTQEQAELINREGLLLVSQNRRTVKKMSASRMSEQVKREEMLIVAVKQYQLKDILSSIGDIVIPLLFLQNGYAHIDLLKNLSSDSIFVGAVEHGAFKQSGNSVEHTGMGKTRIAAFSGDLALLPFSYHKNNDFPFVLEEDYREMLIEKLAANCVINPLTGILGVKNGALIENPYYYQVFKALFHEISKVLELKEPQSHFERITQICRNTSENTSSMLSDLENGRSTEIDSILGYAVAEAKANKKEIPLAAALLHMIKGKEAGEGLI